MAKQPRVVPVAVSPAQDPVVSHFRAVRRRKERDWVVIALVAWVALIALAVLAWYLMYRGL